MKKLLNVLTICWLAAFAVNAYATGIYYDPDRNGEGILVYSNDQNLVFYLFTYGQEQCDEEYRVGVDVYKDCNQNGQKWYFASDSWGGDNTSGFLFEAEGIDYPKGKPDPQNPYGAIVGEPKAIGVYIIEFSDGGYRMVVVPFGDVDPELDLYNRVYDFNTRIFP